MFGSQLHDSQYHEMSQTHDGSFNAPKSSIKPPRHVATMRKSNIKYPYGYNKQHLRQTSNSYAQVKSQSPPHSVTKASPR